jgi:hypothetical protein
MANNIKKPDQPRNAMKTYRKMCGVLIAMAMLAAVFGCA